MAEELNADKVFISYSWAKPGMQEWVYDLATRLTDDGVEVVLDKWDSVEGQNLNAFMQRSVNDPTIKKVLVICDEAYTNRANGFEGGVGTETVIISDEVYKDVQQTKFIPIIAQRGTNGEEYIPTYLSGTKYIDMSSEQDYEDGYERLIRNLYHKPEYVRPKLGKPPRHLLKDEKTSDLSSNYSLKRFRNFVEKRPDKVNIYVNDFYEVFKKDYVSYAIMTPERETLANQVYSTFYEMIELRNIYVDFFQTYIREAEEVSVQHIIDFLESLYPLIETKPESKSYYESQFDHMKLFVTELIIYTISILFKNGYYSSIKELIKNHYFVTDNLGRNEEGSIGIFRFYPSILEEVQPQKRSQSKYISYSGHLIIERGNLESISSSELVQADFLLYILSFAYEKLEGYDGWYPPTIPYFTNERIKIINRLKSKRYFEILKGMFEVSNVQEMREMAKEFKVHYNENRMRGIHGFGLGINPDEIAMY